MLLELLSLVLCISLTTSAPTKEEDDGELTIVRCLVEHWGQEEKIQACRNCFDAIGEDVLSATNLPIAKQCTKDHLPMQYSACETQITALEAGQEEQGMQVMQCMGEAMHMNGLTFCLNTTSTDASVTDRLTDASMCLSKGHKHIMKYVKNITMAGASKKDKRKMRKQGRRMKMRMSQLLVGANCDLAAGGDASKDKACIDCFKLAAESFKNSKDKATLMTDMAQCSAEHLGDTFSECTALMKTAPKDAKKCYKRVLTKSEVDACTDDSSAADVETLAAVMECTKKRAIAWIKENASGNMGDKVIEMLGGEEDEDDSQEDLE